MSRVCVVVLLLALGVTAAAASPVSPSFRDRDVIRDSLQQVPAKLRGDWLESRGYDASYWTRYRAPESTGLRLVGKYGRGPSNEVTGQDTLVALTLGSEVALLSFADPDRPRVLSEIQLDCIVRQSQLRDSLLFTGGNGIRIWNVSDATRPVERGLIPYGVGDFSVQDSLVCFVSLDTFFVYSASDPANPRRLGYLPDSGHVAAATPRVAVLIQPNDVLGFIDITDPANPRHVGSWPGWARSADARGNLLCVTFTDPANQDRAWLLTIDMSNPVSPRQLGRVDSVCGYDLHIEGDYAFASGRYESYEGFKVVDISDSTSPRALGTFDFLGAKWGVWANLSWNKALVADDGYGLLVLDIANLNAPTLDTILLRADLAEDVWVDGSRAYVADYRGGMRILDVSDPTQPFELGGRDSTGATCVTTVARDSFAFLSWRPGLQYQFRTILVDDPVRPREVAGLTVPSRPEDMVLRDTLVYAVGNQRFYIVNVARPREPRLVGSCGIGSATDLTLTDTLALASRNIVNIADPANPVSLGTFPVGGNGNAVQDTFVYQPAAYDSLVVFSVADPLSPRRVTSLVLSGGHIWSAGVVLVDTLLYIGGDILHILSVADPARPREVGSWRPPHDIRRLHHDGQHLYAACYDAGVCVLESSLTGVTEPRGGTGKPLRGLRVWPTPTAEPLLYVAVGDGPSDGRLALRDATGRQVGPEARTAAGAACSIDISSLPAGVYFAEHRSGNRRQTVKLVKR